MRVSRFLGFGSLVLVVGLISPASAIAQSFSHSLVVGEEVLFVANPDSGFDGGMVHVMARRLDGAWTELAPIVPRGSDFVRFGSAMAFDAGTLAVLAQHEVRTNASVTVVEQFDGHWVEQQRLALGPGALAGQGVNPPVSIDMSAGWMVVGLPEAGSGDGRVEIFRRTDGRWEPARTLGPPPMLDPQSRWGASVAIAGHLLFVGAPGHGSGRGAAFCYTAVEDSWSSCGRLPLTFLDSGSSFGEAIDGDGETILVGVPGARQGRGVVITYRGSVNDGWRVAAVLSPFVAAASRFGSSVALSGDVAVVGAPGAGEDWGGSAFLFERAAGRAWDRAARLVSPQEESGRRFGRVVAVGLGSVFVSSDGEDGGLGAAYVFDPREPDAPITRLVGAEATPFSDYGASKCINGSAAVFSCRDVDMLSHLTPGELGAVRGGTLNDIWGWANPETGSEVALVGLEDRISFVDVSDPRAPALIGSLLATSGTRASPWRDVKVFGNFAYVVADQARGRHGVQVFDLRRLPRAADARPATLQADYVYDGVANTHNIAINTETGFAYLSGVNGPGETCDGGLHVLSLVVPARPSFETCVILPTPRRLARVSHDAQCVVYGGPDPAYQGREVCFVAAGDGVSILDVTDKASPTPIADATYPSVAFAHQGWLSEDHRWFFQNDELDEIDGSVARTRTLIWDVGDLREPILAAEHRGDSDASDHNLFVRSAMMFQANYHDGLRVLDITDPSSPSTTAYFDTAPTLAGAGFGGAWSVFPFLPSGNVLVSSRREGLFVLALHGDPLR